MLKQVPVLFLTTRTGYILPQGLGEQRGTKTTQIEALRLAMLWGTKSRCDYAIVIITSLSENCNGEEEQYSSESHGGAVIARLQHYGRRSVQAGAMPAMPGLCNGK